MAYAHLPMDRSIVLIEPGPETDGGRFGPTRGPDIRHDGLWGNFRAARVGESVTESIASAAVHGTVIIQWQPIMDRVSAGWTLEMEGVPYNIVGAPQQLDLRRHVRFTVVRSA